MTSRRWRWSTLTRGTGPTWRRCRCRCSPGRRRRLPTSPRLSSSSTPPSASTRRRLTARPSCRSRRLAWRSAPCSSAGRAGPVAAGRSSSGCGLAAVSAAPAACSVVSRLACVYRSSIEMAIRRNCMLKALRTLLVLGVLAASGAQPASAQTAPRAPSGDQIDLIGLKTRQPSPDSPPTAVQFEVTVRYQLQSADNGFVLLFLFENNAETSTQKSSEGIPVQRGSGQLVLDIDYAMRPDVRNLSLVAGVFRPPQRLLAWVSTNPIDLAPWPGRVAFEKAIAERLANEYPAADQELSAAIQASPDTGNYYYWRGDT